MKNKIKGLIRLQACDNKIKDVSGRKKEGPLKIRRLEDELNRNEIRVQDEMNQLESLKKDRRSMEQDIQELENKIEKSNIKLNNVKSNKEYSAALKEIDDLTREKSLIEDKVIQLMENIEQLEKKCLEDRDEQTELKKKFEMDRDETEKELIALEKESETLEIKRDKFYQTIDQDILNKYLLLKERKGGWAIGPVLDGVCQVCHVRIPPQQFNELIKGQSLLTCPNCSRMIYWGEDEHLQDLTSD